MVKLYLASHQIPTPQDLHDLLGVTGRQPRVAYIPNAMRPVSKTQSGAIKYFTTLDMHAVVIDITSYDNPYHLQSILSKCDLMWAGGGDPHTLLNAMHNSGYVTILNQLLDDGVVYGGASAGAMVAGYTLAGIPTMLKRRAPLNLVDKFILPHANKKNKPGVTQYLYNLYSESPKLLALTDKQAWLVNDDEGKLVEKQTKPKTTPPALKETP